MPAWSPAGASKNRTSNYAFSNNPNAQGDNLTGPYSSSSPSSATSPYGNHVSQHARSDSAGRSTAYSAVTSSSPAARDQYFPNKNNTIPTMPNILRNDSSESSNFNQSGYSSIGGSREGGMPLLGAGGFTTRDSSASGHSDFSVSSAVFLLFIVHLIQTEHVLIYLGVSYQPPSSRRYTPSASRGSISGSVAPSVSEQYDLPVDPSYWQDDMNLPEADGSYFLPLYINVLGILSR
jgi:hypothetical protein